MKKLFSSLAIAALAMAGTASAQVTNYVPDGGFESPSGLAATNYWAPAQGIGTYVFSFPTSGGSPLGPNPSGGYATINQTAGAPYYALLIEGTNGDINGFGGTQVPVPIASLGLLAGNTYTFVEDMELISGASIGGMKVEFDNVNGGSIGDTGDMFPGILNGGAWATYSFPVTLPAGTVKLKIMPEWGPNSYVGYDNVGVIVPATPLTVAITSPSDSATVNTSFTIVASAAVSPGTVTNVAFYDNNGATLLGHTTTIPFSFNVVNAALGSHALTAVAMANGLAVTSAVVNVTVMYVAPNYPTNNAPIPTRPQSKVIAVYDSSNTYTNLSPISLYAFGGVTSMGNYQIVGGNLITSYLGLGYAGVAVNPSYSAATSLNISSMSTMHVDLWTTANQIGIQLQTASGPNNGAGAVYFIYPNTGIVTSNHWVSLDIPLSVFKAITPALDLTHIDQILWIDNFGVANSVVNGDFYIDNVYFWTTNQVHSSIALGKYIGWTANSIDFYQPQKTINGSSWANLGGLVGPLTVTNAYDASPVPFYQVEDIVPVQIVVNGGFENDTISPPVPDNWIAPLGNATVTTLAAHTGSQSVDLVDSSSGGSTYIQQGLLPITAGATYYLSAWSEFPPSVTESNFSASCTVQWFDPVNNYLGANSVPLASVSGSWTYNTTSGLTPPAGATQAQIQVNTTTPAIAGSQGEIYVDDVSLATVNGGTTNIISATVQPGAGITWQSVPGNTYTVQSTVSLGSPAWASLGANVVGTGTNSVPDVINSSSKFYRVLENY